MSGGSVKPNAGTEVLRPWSAKALPIIVWTGIALLAADALWRGGINSLLRFGPGLILVAVLMWVVFWAPRLIVEPSAVEIRNIMTTYRAPLTALEHVGIGAMVRIEARTESGTTRSITAWNAPGLKRDKVQPQAHTHRTGTPRPNPTQRLVADQQSCPSYILYQRWMAAESAGTAGGTGVGHGVLTSRVNWCEVLMLVCALGLVFLQVLL